MVSVQLDGRLGNNMFQYAAAVLFANKFDLSLNVIQGYCNHGNVNQGIFRLEKNIQPGCRVFQVPGIEINDTNFISYMQRETIEEAHYTFKGFFQLKDFILTYKNTLKTLYKFEYNKRKEDELLVHVRIGDIVHMRHFLPLEYYIDACNRSGCKGGYIISDSPEHEYVVKLKQMFNLQLLDDDIPGKVDPKEFTNQVTKTMSFAKDFNNIVISEGTFSWWIAFLSNAKNVFYNNRSKDYCWTGDIYVFPEWKALHYNN